MLDQQHHWALSAAAAPLVTPLPQLSAGEAMRLARDAFGIEGTATPLGGERDLNLRIDGVDGRSYSFKVSSPADSEDALDLQAQALRHVAEHDPQLPVMRVVPSLDGRDWIRTHPTDGTGYLVRMFTLVPGRMASAEELSRVALRAYGSTVARMARALRGFFHPAARYEILWDLRHTARLRPMLEDVPQAHRQKQAERILDRFDRRVGPLFEGLRAQILHNDLTLDNVLLDQDGLVSGIVDVGDLTHTALVADLAIALAGVMWRRPDPVHVAEEVVAGYVGVLALEDDEAHLMGDLVAARLAAWGLIAAWRAKRHPDNAAYITSGEDDAWELLAQLEAMGPDLVSRRLRTAARGAGIAHRISPTTDLARRRRHVLGAAPLSYREPVHLVAGEGVWLDAADGRRYLDAYNNVPVVGHAHPAVSAAISGQSRTLATNTRYLHEAAVSLAERLVETMPGGLDTVLLVNSGSEANDLAWQLAMCATGRSGAITSAHAYHGITEATAALSPEVWPPGYQPSHVETVPAPSGAALAFEDGGAVGHAIDAAVAALGSRDIALAAMIADPAFTSDGILTPEPEQVRQMTDAVRRAGGLLIIDEVQTGHGRCGSHLWGFEAAGIVPDVVTLGKPMGNGHPVAAVITRADIAASLTERTEVFSTFGGNPVSCVAALAVLDVIHRDGLLDRATVVGDRLRRQLRALAERYGALGQVRGRGMLTGVDIVAAGSVASGKRAAALVEGLRHRGVLIGATGPRGDVLKIRPPLVFDQGHADLLVAAMDEVLGEDKRLNG